MSLKLIELQVALPKSVDAGKIMEQTQQASAIMQGNLQAENRKKTYKKIEKRLLPNNNQTNYTITKKNTTR
ncbi:hypothetical protein [Bacillus coahuilensis]|uniref:hypothetical protein n=1 Tax=Bacillus coahuilensis TaxID=408580 RepID=UPI0001850D7A|nr:hypothetical protein [Bacillus coahuilensis]